MMIGLALLPACGPTGSGELVTEEEGANAVIHGDPPGQSVDVSGGPDLRSG